MMRALGVVWDLIVLNLLFLVCCIPVVTIGPAITALHYVTTKMAGEKDGTPVVGNFFNIRNQIIFLLRNIRCNLFFGLF